MVVQVLLEVVVVAFPWAALIVLVEATWKGVSKHSVVAPAAAVSLVAA